MNRTLAPLCAAACLAAFALPAMADGHAKEASFFLTSAGPGAGGDLGGLAGADAHCAALADAAGLPAGDWVAYLSATGVNARDRIGTGPWYNVEGTQVAADVDDLHGTGNGLGKTGSLSEAGNPINGRGDSPNRHDILTGSNLDGTLIAGQTCNDWTASDDEHSAQVGHHDLTGGGQNPTSFNSAHASRGCSQTALQGTGGDGLFYCFRAD
jgi:hypothetical protein